jgi:hypothetical protein
MEGIKIPFPVPHKPPFLTPTYITHETDVLQDILQLPEIVSWYAVSNAKSL